MTSPASDAVIAGSKGFALALLAPLTERVGTRPRIAADPVQAIALCREGGLLVFEFQGEGSLRAIQDLVLQGTDLRIVAAVPQAHAAAEGALRALGIDLVRWDGKPDGVLGAVARQLSAAQAIAAAAAARVASAVRATSRAAVSPAAAGAAPAPPSKAAAQPTRGAKPAPPSAGPPPPKAPAAAAPAASKVAVPAAAPPIAKARTAPPTAPPGAEPPGLPPAQGAPPATEPPPGPGFFDDLVAGEFHMGVSEDEGLALDAPSAASGGGPWPNVPSGAEAADALARGLAGQLDPPGGPLAAVATVVSDLSDLERAAFAGEPQPIDAQPIRRATVMRVRVSAALAMSPGPGGEVDGGAVSALLAEIDALLSDVNALAQTAPAELQPGLEQVRNALVRDAIDFSEAAHRAAPSGEVAQAPAALHGKATRTRVVAVASKAEQEIERGEARRHRLMSAVLALAVLIAGAYHGYVYWERRQAIGDAVPQTRSGLPQNARVFPASDSQPIVVRSNDGKAFSEQELKRIRDAEELRGNTVREMGPGVVMIVPPSVGARALPQPQPPQR